MSDRFPLPGLARLRQSRGFTRRQLAAEAGVSVGGIRHWEAGDRRWPDAETMSRLAGALGVTVPELYVVDDDEADAEHAGRQDLPVGARP